MKMTTRALKRVLVVLDVVAVSAALWVMAGFVWTEAPRIYRNVSVPLVAAGDAVVSVPPLSSYASCWKCDAVSPRGRPSTARPSHPSPPPSPPPTPSSPAIAPAGYTLYTTFIVAEGGRRRGYAAIKHPKGEGVFAEGERVGVYTLAAVLPDRVVLKGGGKEFELKISRTMSAAGSSPYRSRKTSYRTPARGGRDRTGYVRQRDVGPPSYRAPTVSPSAVRTPRLTERRTVSEADTRFVMKNLPQVLRDVKIATARTPGGRIGGGVKITFMRKNSIVGKLSGLQAGDVVKAVNGKPIRNMADAMRIYRELMASNAKSVTVEIERNGQRRTILYTLTK